MRLDDPDLRDQLAARYVLGTMSRGACRRFESMMRNDPALEKLVSGWNQRLNFLGTQVEPVEPPADMLARIKQRLGLTPEAESIKTDRRTGFWRSTALFATVTSLVLAAVLVTTLIDPRPVKPVTDAWVSVVNNRTSKTSAWIVQTRLRQGEIVVRSLTKQKLAAGKSYELWLITAKQKNPVSLGLVPLQGTKVLKLKPGKIGYFTGAKALAVSLEPAGGSPTGLPTGPVLFLGGMHKL